jgi:aminopeptidase
VRHWRDIWLHEGFACYSEWLWSELSGGRSAQSHAEDHWRRLSALPQDLVLTDPSRALMFDDRVYKRGALALHAVRLQLGDTRFFEMIRTWVATNLHGTVTTGMFVSHAAAGEGGSLGQLLGDWLFESRLPALPVTGSGLLA